MSIDIKEKPMFWENGNSIKYALKMIEEITRNNPLGSNLYNTDDVRTLFADIVNHKVRLCNDIEIKMEIVKIVRNICSVNAMAYQKTEGMNFLKRMQSLTNSPLMLNEMVERLIKDLT